MGRIPVAIMDMKRRMRIRDLLRANLLVTLTVLSVFLGGIAGFLLRSVEMSEEVVQLISFPGEMFMQVIKMMILPLIFASLVSALAQMDAKEAKQMGLATVAYYLCTATLAIILGITLALSIHPGDPRAKDHLASMADGAREKISTLDTFLDVIRNFFPRNVVEATFQRTQTKYVDVVRNGTAFRTKVVGKAEGTNLLGIIVFCTALGIGISQIGERAKVMVEFFIILDAIIIRWIEILMWFAPVGIASLICSNLLELNDIGNVVEVLLWYVLTVLSGVTIHQLIVVPSLYYILTRRNPFLIYRGMFEAFITALGTASSGAALPTSMRCMEEHCGIDRRISQFVMPLGANVNMDGNALYEAVAVVSIAQLNNIDLTMSQVITISLTATVASLGLNSVPAGLVSILIILNTVGLPDKDVALIITVDWLLDRVRTALCVYGDGFAASTVSHFIKDKLEQTDLENQYVRELKEESEQLNSRRASVQPVDTVVEAVDEHMLKELSKTFNLANNDHHYV